MFFPFRKKKSGALLWGAPLFFLITSSFPAQGLPPTTETYKDIIDKALALSLQKDRRQAIQVLNKSIQKESQKGPPPKELISALDEVATIFYSDKAQQLYELAISLRMTNPSVAVQRLDEASRLEPEQLDVQLEQARLHIILNDCSRAESIATNLEPLNDLESVQLVNAQVALCQGQFEKATRIRGAVDPKKSNLMTYWLSVEADQALRSGNAAKAMEIVGQLKKLSPQFPETYYWQWRGETELKKATEKSAQSYLNSCKTISPRLSRQFLAEPMLCRRVAEVEASLKKMNHEK